MINLSKSFQMTLEQKDTLTKRLSKENVKPLRLFTNKAGSILLECLNKNLPFNREPFYFLIQPKGSEHGKGYKYKYLNQFEMIKAY